jgi:hypothetical protein
VCDTGVLGVRFWFGCGFVGEWRIGRVNWVLVGVEINACVTRVFWGLTMGCGCNGYLGVAAEPA